MKIGILTDSTCDLPGEILDKYDIETIPLSIHFGETVYKDREEIGSEDFFKKLVAVDELPTTSQPAIGLFLQKYREMATEYEAIISIHISSKLSGTMEAAVMASRQLEDLQTVVIDSRSASLGLGFLAIYAARLAREGTELDEIVKKVEKARENISVYFTVNDLSYLQKGGRIGKAQAFLGNILSFYPILTLPGSEGEILPLEKIRGKRKIAARLLDIVEEDVGKKTYWLGLLYASERKSYNHFRQQLNARLQLEEGEGELIAEGWVSPVLGCHVGPSVYGVVILKGDFLKNEEFTR